MTSDNDSSVDYSTAVTAATCAIQSLQESQSEDQRDKTSSTNKNKSKAEDSINPPEPLKIALKSSDETSKKSLKDPDMKVPISTSTSTKILGKKSTHKKKLSFVDANETFSPEPENPAIDVQLGRPSTFPDNHLIIQEEKKPEPEVSMPYRPPSPLPMAQVQPVQPRMQSMTKADASGNAIADSWEKEEMASIKERYEKLRETIDDWETKKKRKAKLKLEKKELVSDNRRTRAAQSYRSEIARIEGIAGGARAQVEENRRNEEYKVRQKANKIRLTGKIPATCFCFRIT